MNEQQTFDHYKAYITKDGTGWTRFNVIEYLCQWPGIDPYKMAAVLTAEGITIHYDDSSISPRENKQKRAKVSRAIKYEAAQKEANQ